MPSYGTARYHKTCNIRALGKDMQASSEPMMACLPNTHMQLPARAPSDHDCSHLSTLFSYQQCLSWFRPLTTPSSFMAEVYHSLPEVPGGSLGAFSLTSVWNPLILWMGASWWERQRGRGEFSLNSSFGLQAWALHPSGLSLSTWFSHIQHPGLPQVQRRVGMIVSCCLLIPYHPSTWS